MRATGVTRIPHRINNVTANTAIFPLHPPSWLRLHTGRAKAREYPTGANRHFNPHAIFYGLRLR
jgi:hypothetical protein